MYFSVDRFEGNQVILIGDNGEKRVQPLSFFSISLREGDILKETEDGYIMDSDETNRRREEARRLLNELFRG